MNTRDNQGNAEPPATMKIATYNVNSIRRRLPILLEWIAEHKPDVMCLQETKVQDADFPVDAIREAGYVASFRGMKAYNGVATLTRTPPEKVIHGLRSLEPTWPAASAAPPAGQEVGETRTWLYQTHA